jgi:hypothetical protein
MDHLAQPWWQPKQTRRAQPDLPLRQLRDASSRRQHERIAAALMALRRETPFAIVNKKTVGNDR